MSGIKVERNPPAEQLQHLGVDHWGVWEKECSTFPWTYDAEETCYFLDGEVIVTPKDGEAIRMGKGDMVIFPKGMSCTWQILKDVRKHYRFS